MADYLSTLFNLADGGELAVLTGAERVLRQAGARTVFIELEENTPEYPRVVGCLESGGFRREAKYAAVPGASGRLARFYNYLFVRSQNPAPEGHA